MTEGDDNLFRITFNDKKYIVASEKMRYDKLMSGDPAIGGKWLRLVGQGNLVVHDGVYSVLARMVIMADGQRESVGISPEDIQEVP